MPSIRTLIIAEDPDTRKEIRERMGTASLHQFIFYEGETLARGYELARTRNPDLVLCDLSTDHRNVVRIVRQIMSAPNPPRLIGMYNPLKLRHQNVAESQVFLECVRSGFSDFLRMPIAPAELDEILGRLFPVEETAPRPSVNGSTIILFSPKGGVGKTTISVNLACLLAQRVPNEVVLVDGALHTGNAADFMDLRPQYDLSDAARAGSRLDTELLMSFLAYYPDGNLYYLDTPSQMADVGFINDETVGHILLLLQSMFRFVVVDTFPVLDSVSLAIIDLARWVLLITEGAVPVVKGTRAMLRTFEQIEVDPGKIQIILNRYSSWQGNIKPGTVAEGLQHNVDHILPFDRRHLPSVNQGRPFVLDFPNAEFSIALMAVAESLSAELGALERPPWWQRWLGLRSARAEPPPGPLAIPPPTRVEE